MPDLVITLFTLCTTISLRVFCFRSICKLYIFSRSVKQRRYIMSKNMYQKKERGAKTEEMEHSYRYFCATALNWINFTFYFSFSQFRITGYGNIALISYETSCTKMETFTETKMNKTSSNEMRTHRSNLIKWRIEYKGQISIVWY